MIHEYLSQGTEINSNNVTKRSYDMIIDCIKDMCINSNDYTFYCHNLGKFYSIYILKALIYYSTNNDNLKLKILRRDNIIKITIKIYHELRIYGITILNSLLVLNSSLRILGKFLNIKTIKGNLPYDWVTNNLHYKGPNNIGAEQLEYLKKLFPDNNMSCREALKMYLETDVLLLLRIVNSFKWVVL